MKKKEILEILVANPQAIFLNANTLDGKFSEYPQRFQVVRTSPTYDKSVVFVQSVLVNVENWLKTEDGKFVEDENGRHIQDTRPISERTTIKLGEIKSMPLRLVVKSDLTEASILADYIAKHEKQQQADREREERWERNDRNIQELKSVMISLGLLTEEEAEGIGTFGHFNLALRDEKIPMFTAVLKSALVEAGV